MSSFASSRTFPLFVSYNVTTGFSCIFNVDVQSAPSSLSLSITATYGPLVLSKGSLVHGIAP